MQTLAGSLARTAAAREPLQTDNGWAERLRRPGAALGQGGAADDDPAAAALEAEVRATGEIIRRVAHQFARHQRVHEGRAEVLGGALAGA